MRDERIWRKLPTHAAIAYLSFIFSLALIVKLPERDELSIASRGPLTTLASRKFQHLNQGFKMVTYLPSEYHR